MQFDLRLILLALLFWPAGELTGQDSLKPGQPTLDWQELDAIPNETGLAGPVVGVHRGTLIVGGGANFPNGVPWHQGDDGTASLKTYHDVIYLKPSADQPWQTSDVLLPQKMAYAASISTPEGILVLGGQRERHEAVEDGSVTTSMVYLDTIHRVSWDGNDVQVDGQYSGKPLPPLPNPTTSLVAGLIGSQLYVLAGETEQGAKSSFWVMDLAADELRFIEAPSFPGSDRGFAISAVQSDGRESCLYVFSGRSKNSGTFELFTDAWKYVPSESNWVSLGEIQIGESSQGRCLMAGFGAPYGANHILLGGGDQETFRKLNIEMVADIQAARDRGDESSAQQMEESRLELLDNHPGFDRDVFAFNAVTNAYYKIGEFPERSRTSTSPGQPAELATGSHVTTTAVIWNGKLVVPSGEIAPGVRSPSVWAMRVAPVERGLGLTNWIVMGTYLALLVGIGLYFSKGNRSSDDYFLAGGRVPWWAAGLSVFATMLSAITYISIPARAYGTDWSYFLVAMGIPLACVLVVFFYLPHFRKLKLTSAYQYLEARFHWSLRIFGALTFVGFQFGRMGIVVLIPALALSAVTGLNVYFCIVTMGVLATAYTVMGGVEAVIWTDVLQTVVLFGGAIAAIVIVACSIDGGFAAIWSYADEHNKLALVRNWHQHDLSWTKDGILVLLIGALFSNLLPYSSDQAVVQRYMTVKDDRAARKAIWTNAVMCIPASFLFYMVGASLFVFFSQQPESLAPIAKSDQVFPWFFFFQMPAGLAGLVFAGVLAAAMSSLDSSMHSIATVLSKDFYQRFNPEVEDQKLLKFAKSMTVILGVIGTVSACVMASTDIKYLLDLFLDFVGVLLGPLGGLFALGIFVRRCAAFHAWVAVIVSTGLLLLVNGFLPLEGASQRWVHPLVNGGVAMGACVLVGWLLSVLIPMKSRVVQTVKLGAG